MKDFIRTIFIFLYICLVLFIKSDVVLAHGSYIPNNRVIDYISEQKSEINFFEGHETYYAVVQNTNNPKYTNNNNKNSALGHSVDGENALLNNLSNYFITNKNIICLNRISYKISPNLKNAINTRAP